jgi:hypothetical protein
MHWREGVKSMRTSLATLGVIAAAAGLVAAPIEAARPSGEERLAKLIEGRTAGEPRSCIVTNPSRSLTIIDKTAIVYRQGRRVWVNRTAHPEDLDEDDIMVIRRWGASLCRTDMITQVDRLSGMFTGAIFLTDFVPYEKAG